ncbi:MAG: 30S ribosome-binding factor RbfA [Bacteroidetes bacterium]|nr:30S ribosome-binding factor RbfA [Bacteroidota bacterium]
MEKETQRQKKVSRSIMRDISDIFQKEGKEYTRGAVVSVTQVRIVPDLSYAKIYLSVFPFDKSEEILERVRTNDWQLRMWLGKRVRTQLRIVPKLTFHIDDSLEYVANIDSLLAK